MNDNIDTMWKIGILTNTQKVKDRSAG